MMFSTDEMVLLNSAASESQACQRIDGVRAEVRRARRVPRACRAAGRACGRVGRGEHGWPADQVMRAVQEWMKMWSALRARRETSRCRREDDASSDSVGARTSPQRRECKRRGSNHESFFTAAQIVAGPAIPQAMMERKLKQHIFQSRWNRRASGGGFL